MLTKATPKSLQAWLAKNCEQFFKFPHEYLEGVLQITLKIDKGVAVSSLYMPCCEGSVATAHQGVGYYFLCAKGRDLYTNNSTLLTERQTILPSPRILPPTLPSLAIPSLWGNFGSRIHCLPCPPACGTFTSSSITLSHHKAYGMWLGKNSMPGGEHSKASAFLCCSLF